MSLTQMLSAMRKCANGDHCYHPPSKVFAEYEQHVCCHCGKTRHQVQREALQKQGHGAHLP